MAIDISNRPDRPRRQIVFEQRKKSGLSADVLKYIAVLAMVIDHIAWAFVPFNSIQGQAMHVVGRITAPIMCFMAAEGYYYTRDRKKYALRLGVFAVISHIPFVFFEYNSIYPLHNTSVIFTIFLGIIALMIQDSPKLQPWTKGGLFIAICIIAMIGDWNAIAVIWIYYFYQYRYSREAQIKSFCVISIIMLLLESVAAGFINGFGLHSLFQLGVFLAVPLLMKYNGTRKGGSFNKWFFYIFYPAHLLILGILKYYILCE